MPKLSFLYVALFFVGCFHKEQEPNSLFQIYNCILNYEIQLIRTCEQDYDDSFSYENIPEGIFIKSFPPFDSLPCITVINGNAELEKEYLTKHCIVFNLFSIQNANSFINSITYKRVKAFLNPMKEIGISIDVSNFTINKAGMEITTNGMKCTNQFSDIYNFSNLLINEKGDKAVVFCHIQGHSEQKAAYFLRKLGEIWYLEIKEHM